MAIDTNNLADRTENKAEDKPKREIFIFKGNLAEAREAFGENLAVSDTGKPNKQVSGVYF
jgi:hypothetical protein